MKDDQSFETNTVRAYPCSSWDDFVAKVRAPSPQLSMVPAIYRGHAKTDWLLWSKLDLQLSYTVRREDGQQVVIGHARGPNRHQKFDEICNGVFERFLKFARTLPEAAAATNSMELWAIGRHYGLLTPLLDWTESPYVAAFFAFADAYRQFEPRAVRSIPRRSHRDCVRVWGLRPLVPDLERPGEFEVIRDLPIHAHRQRAQSGLFTVLWSDDFADLLSYLVHREAAHCLEHYDIPIGSTLDALQDLQLMNITPATLFPDLFGAAWQANIDVDEIRLQNLLMTEMEDLIAKEAGKERAATDQPPSASQP